MLGLTPIDSVETLSPGMRFQSTAAGYEHVVCTFGGAAPRFFAAMVARGEWRYVGTDKGHFPRAAVYRLRVTEAAMLALRVCPIVQAL